MCAKGKYSIGTGNTECTPCAPGYHQELTGAGGCDPCNPGTSTNGQYGSAWVKCPGCEQGSYCGHLACAECTSCSITEYTEKPFAGVGAFAPSNCASWDAVMGFRYLPDQCQIVWVVLAILLLLIAAVVFTRAPLDVAMVGCLVLAVLAGEVDPGSRLNRFRGRQQVLQALGTRRIELLHLAFRESARLDEGRPSDDRLIQVTVFEDRVVQARAAQLRPTKVGLDEPRRRKIGPLQPSVSKVDPT